MVASHPPPSSDHPQHSREAAATSSPLGISNQRQDDHYLFQLCRDAVETDDDGRKWNLVSEWIESQEESTVLAQGRFKDKRTLQTPLHLLYKQNAPLHVAALVLAVLPKGASTWKDARGQTPLHLACHYGASPDLVELLLKSSSSSDATTTQPFSSSCTAPQYQARAQHLTELTDHSGRTPLHCALERATNENAPELVKLLLKLNPNVKQIKDDHGRIPLTCLNSIETDAYPEHDINNQERQHILQCLDAYIDSVPVWEHKTSHYHQHHHRRPQGQRYQANSKKNDRKSDKEEMSNPYDNFFYTLSGLQEWMLDHAALNTTLQELINHQMASPGVAFFAIYRFYTLVTIILCLQLFVSTTGPPSDTLLSSLISASSFNVIERVFSIGLRICRGQCFARFRRHPSEIWYLLMGVFTLDLAINFSVDATQQEEWPRFWTVIVAIIVGIAWMGVTTFFRLVFMDFAEFYDGMTSLTPKITSFMFVLTIVLVAFAQLVYILARDTNGCNNHEGFNAEENGDIYFCSFAGALLKTYTMSVGEVDLDDLPESDIFAVILFIIFVYVVVILLANILAFIIGNDIWRSERTTQDFWLNRLHFLAETQFLTEWCHKNRQARFRMHDVFQESWASLMSVFKDKGLGTFSFRFWYIMLLRLFSLIAMSIWLVIGVLCFGILLPPQARRYMFWAPIKKKSLLQSAGAQSKQHEQQIVQKFASVEQEVDALKERVNTLADSVQTNTQTIQSDMKTLEEKLDRLILILERKHQ